jgi:hypothetical protein
MRRALPGDVPAFWKIDVPLFSAQIPRQLADVNSSHTLICMRRGGF